jgi:uncharacterized membrane protein
MIFLKSLRAGIVAVLVAFVSLVIVFEAYFAIAARHRTGGIGAIVGGYPWDILMPALIFLCAFVWEYRRASGHPAAAWILQLILLYNQGFPKVLRK